MNQNPQLPKFLIDELKKGNGVLFIGAGLSMGAGLPSWKELVEPLADEIGAPKTDLLKIPQYYVQHCGSRVPLYRHLRRAIKAPNPTPTENHRFLAQLPVSAIFTTNYDELLEDTLREAKTPFRCIVLDKGIGNWNEAEEIQLVKLHGSIDDEQTIIITEDDYRTYFREHEAMRKQLESLFMTKTFLFVGYSLTDPDFGFVYDEIQTYLGKEKRPAYALMFNVNQFELNNYRERGLTIINISVESGADYSAALQNVLEGLVEAVKGTEIKPIPASPPRAPRKFSEHHWALDLIYNAKTGDDLAKAIAELDPDDAKVVLGYLEDAREISKRSKAMSIAKGQKTHQSTASESSAQAEELPNKTELRRKILSAFNEERLAILCADIEQRLEADNVQPQTHVNLEIVGGRGLEAKILNLILHLDRRGLLKYLIDAVREAQPGLI